ncbi:FAD-linked oxidase C-terminal domain-containing protein [Klebsiella pneumoniae]|nr:FAD-linked oxidase C-terminal domain-containing protein [Klebsiella pneumoniae]
MTPSTLRCAMRPLWSKRKPCRWRPSILKFLNLAREDIVWHSVSELITDVPDKEMLGLNIVEFAGDDAALIDQQVTTLCQRLDELMAASEAGVIGWQVCHDLEGVERIYAMRKKAVGLLGNAKGAAKPIPFAEDTCVPPEHLADYIVEFRALLDSHGLSYGMFGHVDAGVLHVPGAGHVRSAAGGADEADLRRCGGADGEVCGLLWGEHGKGFRAEYSPASLARRCMPSCARSKRSSIPITA